MHLRALYESLLGAYGPQGWWPVADEGMPYATYKKRVRLTPAQQWEVCAGALLTQNTSWKNAEKALAALRKAKALSVETIARIPEKRLVSLIHSAGYFNQKALRLCVLARHVQEKYNGKIEVLLSKPLPLLRAELLELNGIGPETADSILVYAAGKPAFIADTYARRILGRVHGTRMQSYEAQKKDAESRLPSNPKMFNEFHALLVEHAKRHCKKNNPVCERCPVYSHCAYALEYSSSAHKNI
ncbi:MAG: endonuclease III domain-containing protein [Candidatus Diapherotrites archaeon]|nr:endonuclease III domain-containing protein [Candidatus Diapherotrites archaeon]